MSEWVGFNSTIRLYIAIHVDVHGGSKIEVIEYFCQWYVRFEMGGTTAAAPLPCRPSDSALCGSRPLVTTY